MERYADALAIAALPGAAGELWERAQKKYMAAAPRPYMAIAQCILEGDFTGATPLPFLSRRPSASKSRAT